jgi:hypothetical protein
MVAPDSPTDAASRRATEATLHPFPAAVLLLATSTSSALGAGLTARFLPASGDGGEPATAAARYDIYRAEGAAGLPVLLGSLPASGDTLAFPDSSAHRGLAYAYTAVAIDSAGAESDPSEPTWAGFPRLALPDTARLVGGILRLPLDAGADPLRGLAGAPALVLSADPQGRVGITYDTSSGVLELRALPGTTGALRLVLQAGYHGKFLDEDTVDLVVETPVGLAGQAMARPVIGAERAGIRLRGGAPGWVAPGPGSAGPWIFDPAGRRLRAATH